MTLGYYETRCRLIVLISSAARDRRIKTMILFVITLLYLDFSAQAYVGSYS